MKDVLRDIIKGVFWSKVLMVIGVRRLEKAVKMHLCGMSVLIIVHVLRLTSSIELHIHRFI